MLAYPSSYFPRENTLTVEERIVHKSGNIYIRKYTKGIIIGKGGFAKCYVFKNLDTGKVYAGKVIEKSSLTKERAKQKLVTEIKIHRSLKHPNIVLFKHNFEDSHFVYIILELCPNQTLMELVKRNSHLSEAEVRLYVTQLVSALKYLHGQQIIHRDLKLGNLFLDPDMNLKLGDFGLATKLNYPNERKRTICGTPNYIAPEVLNSSAGHSYEADIWSLGVIIYTVLVGKPPFETKDVKSTYQKIRANRYEFPDYPQISEKSKSLVRTILHTVPEARPHLDDIMEHPFFVTSENLNVAYETLNMSMSSPLEERAKDLMKAPDIVIKPQLERTISSRLPFSRTHRRPSRLSRYSSSLTGRLRPPTLRFSLRPPPSLTAAELEVADIEEAVMDTPRPTIPVCIAEEPHATLPAPDNGADITLLHNRETLDAMHYVLDYCLQHNTMPQLNPFEPVPISPNNWITHYVDYTQKYGMGYLMCDGSIGIYFNDATKIILESSGAWFEYYERSQSSREAILPQRHTLSVFPDQLQKKVTLLVHFRDYLRDQSDRNPRTGQAEIEALARGSPSQNMVYVKKWVKTRHAVLFRMSNRSIQISFFDNSEVLLCSDARMVSFLDRTGYRVSLLLEDFLKMSRPDVIKRLKYARDILKQLIQEYN